MWSGATAGNCIDLSLVAVSSPYSAVRDFAAAGRGSRRGGGGHHIRICS
jgi:hypothetical protein